MSFWANYVVLKEEMGVPREETLALIEQKLGLIKRQEIEEELAGEEE